MPKAAVLTQLPNGARVRERRSPPVLGVTASLLIFREVAWNSYSLTANEHITFGV